LPNDKYHSHVEPNLELITSWREAGFTERQISVKLHIAYSTFRKYRDREQALSAALRASKEKLVANLKKSLWQEAIGYDYSEVQEYMEVNTDEEKEKENNRKVKPKKIKKTITKKKARGVPSLLMFALCNLAPEDFTRADKTVDEKLNDAIDGINDLKERYSNDLIKKAFDVLYPNVSKKIEENKKKELEKDEKS